MLFLNKWTSQCEQRNKALATNYTLLLSVFHVMLMQRPCSFFVFFPQTAAEIKHSSYLCTKVLTMGQ